MTGPYLRYLKRSLNACAGSPSKGVGNYKPSYYSCGEAGGNYYSYNDKFGSSSDDSSSSRSYSYSGGGDGDYTVLWIILGVMFGIPLLLWINVCVVHIWKKWWGKYKHRHHMRQFDANFRTQKESSKADEQSTSGPTENDVVSGFNCNARDQLANQLYWKLVLASRPAFNDTKDGKEKQEIVESIHDAIAARNGRFLRRDAVNGRWEIIAPARVQFKVRQALHPKACVPNYYMGNEKRSEHQRLPEKGEVLLSHALNVSVQESDETTQTSSTTSSLDLSYLPHCAIPTDNDVVSGPSCNSKNQPANQLYWKLVLAAREAFNETNDRKEKEEIVRSIHDAIAATNGRFLHRETKTRRWLVLPPNKIHFKIRQALHPRAGVPKYVLKSEETTPEYGVGAARYLFEAKSCDKGQQTTPSVDLEAQQETTAEMSEKPCVEAEIGNA